VSAGRPRDRLGRPLPPGARDERWDTGPHPQGAAQVLALADRLLAGGRPFEAHEVLEEEWKRAGPARDLWRALAQVAVARTHQLRGNPAGARALALRSRLELVHWQDRVEQPAALVDVAGLIAYAGRLEAAADPVEPPRLGRPAAKN
jgi:uncharacterized protein